ANREGFRDSAQSAQAVSDNSLVALFEKSAVKVVADQFDGNFREHVFRASGRGIVAPALAARSDVGRNAETLRLLEMVRREARSLNVHVEHRAAPPLRRWVVVEDSAQ